MSCNEESNNYWNYHDPSQWSKHFPSAAGLYQSPIDINSNDTVLESYPLFIFSSKYDSNELFKLTNNGHQVTATLAEHTYGQNEKDLWFSGSSLTGKFYFVNFHLHWGRNDRHESEHEINGQIFPAEAHVVFKNNETEQLAVFAFLFTIANQWDDENTKWEKYTNAASQLININDTINCTFNLSQLIYGYVLYSTQLKNFIDRAETLFLPWMRDRAVILLDGIIQGVIGWTEKDSITLINLHPSKTNPNPRLDILVENKGRCCGDLPDFGCNFKGMKDIPLLGLRELSNWTITKLPMDEKLMNQSNTFNWKSILSNTSLVSSTFYRSTFIINITQPLHSFLCTDNWGHGFIMINGFNIGRYSEKGPQRTMYVPSHILKQGVNEILVFESDRKQISFDMNERNMTFMDHRLWTN